MCNTVQSCSFEGFFTRLFSFFFMHMKLTLFIALLWISALIVGGCKKDPNAPDTDCASNYTARTELINDRSNPYYVDLDGRRYGTVSANSTFRFTHDAGNHVLKVTQVSGYLIYPSVFTKSGNWATCEVYTWNF